jgi:hypothetical protein
VRQLGKECSALSPESNHPDHIRTSVPQSSKAKRYRLAAFINLSNSTEHHSRQFMTRPDFANAKCIATSVHVASCCKGHRVRLYFDVCEIQICHYWEETVTQDSEYGHFVSGILSRWWESHLIMRTLTMGQWKHRFRGSAPLWNLTEEMNK